MEKLESRLTISLEVIKSPNLCDLFTERDLTCIGNWVRENYDIDCQSRVDWVRRNKNAMDLAMQVQKQKTFPWPDCSNITFPLVTIAALQFSARAYPAIVNGRSVVATRINGPDPTGNIAKIADKIGRHMSYQLLEQDEAWEEGQDRALIGTAITGVGFKKTYQNGSLGHPVSEYVFCNDLVVNYWAKSIESAIVKTHVIPMYRNDMREKMLRGVFCDYTDAEWFKAPAQIPTIHDEDGSDDRSGMNAPQSNETTPFTLLEQHCWIDLDCDGYAEPYIVTIESSANKVLRIVTRFDRMEDVELTADGRIIRIRATEYFTKIPFIPSPDGSLMDIGFGTLLGPLNESVNSAINQLFDSATLSITAGGFLGRGAKIKGGTYSFQPFSWQRVDSTGDDLRKSIVPLPVREPSAVMFQLLGMLIDYTNRVAGSTDMLAGENPGQNTPAETSRAMIEQGQKIYSAIFKRIWRSMKQEFKKLYAVNAVHLPMRVSFGDGDFIGREDYTGAAVVVVPVADPTIASDGARFAQARLLREAAATAAGYDKDEVERRYLKALGIDEVDKLFPGSASMPPPPPDVKITIQELKNQSKQMELEQEKMMFAIKMQEEIKLNEVKILEMTASAEKLMAQATEEPAKNRINAFRAAIEAMRERNNKMSLDLDRLMETSNVEPSVDSGTGGLPSLEISPNNSPLDGLGGIRA